MKPNCSQCKHFFITWNAGTPNGCRLYSIQSKELPSVIVRMAGSGECMGFEQKKKPEAKKDKLDLNRDDLW
jgi:hypothetical protein